MVLVALWAWTDIEIKKMQVRTSLPLFSSPDSVQPYVDLARGQSPAHKSLLLDYTRTK
jgi:hypothetical protein